VTTSSPTFANPVTSASTVDDQRVAAPPVSTGSTFLGDRRVAVVVCAAVGAVGFAHWSLADLSRDATTQQREWPFVLFFSALVFGLGVGMLVSVMSVVPPRGVRR
jgi:hypothetical protein